MRFERINIPAFGPFTELDLSFREGKPDLHVIYGNNEAGKSSLLRAISCLLFGIPKNSADDFLHPYGKLKLRSEIANVQGEKLIFQRRKGAAKTLLDEQGNELREEALAHFLGQVDLSYFTTMFALGGAELRQGAEELLHGRGELGAALFSASMGGAPVQKIIDSFEEEAKALFKTGRGGVSSKVRNNIAAQKELLKEMHQAAVHPDDWEALLAKLATAEEAKNLLLQEIQDIEKGLQWLRRCEDALPCMGQVEEANRQLAELEGLPAVAPDFVSRATAAVDSFKRAATELHDRSEQLSRQKRKLESLPAQNRILDREPLLNQLHQELVVHRDHKIRLTDLRLKLATLENTLKAGMTDLQLEGDIAELEKYQLSEADRLVCNEAGSALGASLDEQARNSEAIANADAAIQDLQKALEKLEVHELSPLREALALAAGATESSNTLPNHEREVASMFRKIANAHLRIPGAPADFEATARLSIPASATIRSYREKFLELQREIDQEEEIIRITRQERSNIDFQLQRLEHDRKLPSREDLTKARAERDRCWGIISARLKGEPSQEEMAPGTSLPEAFQETIQKTDEIADVLIDDADVVALASEKRFQLRELQNKMDQATGNKERLWVEHREALKRWQQEWASAQVQPRSPLEMEEWREAWTDFCKLLEQHRDAEDSLQRKRDKINTEKVRLAGVLNESPEKEFSILFEAVRVKVEAGEKTTGARHKTLQDLEREESKYQRLILERERVAQKVGAAARAWKNECARTGLPVHISPENGLTLLQKRRELLTSFNQWRAMATEVSTLGKLVEDFEKKVTDISTDFQIRRDSIEAAETELWKLLECARRDEAARTNISNNINECTSRLEEGQIALLQAEARIKEFLNDVGLTTLEELEPMLGLFERKFQLQAKIEDARHSLSGLARGEAVDWFIKKVREEDLETLAQRTDAAEELKKVKRQELATLELGIFELSREKAKLDQASDRAAELRQRAELCSASIREDSARFIRLKLAIKLLQAQVEAFRQSNQRPLLRRSGEIFSAITLNAFSGLEAEYGEDDLPILVGVRSGDQKTVTVHGMSDGTRDQLFLALRLAALEKHLEEHEPMPLILDDLLITFDDERCRALLRELNKTASKTQILLFTHHQHLVELCRSTLGANGFSLHGLEKLSNQPHYLQR